MKTRIELPILPNFVKVTTGDGFSVEVGRVDVGELSAADVDDLGRRWTEALHRLRHERAKGGAR